MLYSQAIEVMKMNSYYPKYRGSSVHIDDVLKAIGASYSRYKSAAKTPRLAVGSSQGSPKARSRLARINGIDHYTGSLDQNIYLIGLAKAGRLRKVR